MREVREAEQRRQASTQDSMGLGGKDLQALRYLIQEQSSDRLLRQKDLAHHLGLSNAAVSALIDRLVGAGHLRRISHPEDRRSVALEVTSATVERVRDSLGETHAGMLRAVEGLTPSEQGVVSTFLSDLVRALDSRRAD
ncbi:MarR family transcriptional regulator [Citricoccus nitrophenolicus]|uniref:MarR family transcriptional regulator n=1 Tax=Citricoccus nitrophenolicus TaxID=863575 RepID=A0ABV0IKU4_9MICC